MQKLKGFYNAKMKLPSLLNLFRERPERITVGDLLGMIKAGERVTIIDVRTSDEFINGRIPGSILTSVSNLKCMDEYSYEGRVVLYCTAGVRSYRAGKALAARGIRVVDLIGGINAWEDAGGKTERG